MIMPNKNKDVLERLENKTNSPSERLTSCEDEDAKTIEKGLKSNRTLTELEFSGTDGSALAIAKALETNRTLTLLRIKKGCSVKSALAIAGALGINRTLMSLTLTGGVNGQLDSSEDSEKAIGNIFSSPSLTDLSLSSHHIGAGDATAIARALKHNHALRSLDLRSNYLSSNSLIDIVNALKSNTTLTSLTLDGNNNFDEKVAEKVIKVLESNNTLTSLTYESRIDVEDDQEETIEKLLKKNRPQRLIRKIITKRLPEEKAPVVPQHPEIKTAPISMSLADFKKSSEEEIAKLREELNKIRSKLEEKDEDAKKREELEKNMVNVINRISRRKVNLIQASDKAIEAKSSENDNELKQILDDEEMYRYYEMFFRRMTGIFEICVGIDSGMVKNNEKNKLDHVADVFKAASAAPWGVGVLAKVIGFAIDMKNDQKKNDQVNQVCGFFIKLKLDNNDNAFIKTLAKKLTNKQKQAIKKLVTTPKKSGICLFSTNNSAYNAIEELAKRHCRAIITDIADINKDKRKTLTEHMKQHPLPDHLSNDALWKRFLDIIPVDDLTQNSENSSCCRCTIM